MSIRDEIKTRTLVSPFYAATGVAIIALAVVGVLIATH